MILKIYFIFLLSQLNSNEPHSYCILFFKKDLVYLEIVFILLSQRIQNKLYNLLKYVFKIINGIKLSPERQKLYMCIYYFYPKTGNMESPKFKI